MDEFEARLDESPISVSVCEYTENGLFLRQSALSNSDVVLITRELPVFCTLNEPSNNGIEMDIPTQVHKIAFVVVISQANNGTLH